MSSRYRKWLRENYLTSESPIGDFARWLFAQKGYDRQSEWGTRSFLFDIKADAEKLSVFEMSSTLYLSWKKSQH